MQGNFLHYSGISRAQTKQEKYSKMWLKIKKTRRAMLHSVQSWEIGKSLTIKAVESEAGMLGNLWVDSERRRTRCQERRRTPCQDGPRTSANPLPGMSANPSQALPTHPWRLVRAFRTSVNCSSHRFWDFLAFLHHYLQSSCNCSLASGSRCSGMMPHCPHEFSQVESDFQQQSRSYLSACLCWTCCAPFPIFPLFLHSVGLDHGLW